MIQSSSAEIYFRSIVDTVREMLLILDEQLRIVTANRAFYQLFQVTPEETERRHIYELGSGQWNLDGLRHLLDKVIPSNEQFQNYEVEYDFPVIGHRVMLLNGRRIERGEGRERLILITVEDITGKKMTEKEYVAALQLIERSPDIITRFDREGRHIYVNKTLEQHVGRPRTEILGKTPLEIGVPPGTASFFSDAFKRIIATKKAEMIEVPWGGGVINQAVIVPEMDQAGNIVSFAAYSRDITELKRAERELRESEAKYRTLVERANDGIIIVQDGVIKYANPRMAELDGSSVEHIVGTSYMEHVYPSEVPKLAEIYHRRMRGENIPASYETLLIRSNGEAAPSEVSAAVVNYQGRPADLVIIHDISKFKVTESGLRQKEAEFRTLAENSPDIILRYNSSGRFLYANPKAEPVFGHPPAQLMGKRIDELGMPEEGVKFWMSLIREVFAAKKEKIIEFSFPPGERYFNSHLVPEFDEKGEVTSILSISRDITELKRNEETLRRNEYELRSLSDNSPDLIIRIDNRLRYQYVNTAYERLTGIPKERFTGKTNEELGMPLQLVTYWEKALTKVIESGREYSMEFEMTSLFGRRYFTTRLIPEFVRSGQVETVLVIARDITERVHAEEQLRYISFHDNVTGLFNRAFFEEEIRRIDTERELPISIIMGDVNYLKLSNDVFGHEEGDRLLKAITGMIKAACRKTDIVARWGGDEFAAILPRTEFATADTICRRIQQMGAGKTDTVIRPSIALGVGTKDRKEQNIYQVIRQAEERMYDNKMAGSKQNEQEILSCLMARARERTQDLTAHIEQARILVRRFGEVLHLDEDQLKDLLLLIELHDIGMASVPREILTKSGTLTREEWDHIKRHPEAGYRIVKSFPDTARIADEILAHDERWDGTGYPRGLKGKELPYLARVFALVEAYDVMTHQRPYARVFSHEEAVEEICRNAGRQFDPDLVVVFLDKVIAREPVRV